MSNYLSQIGEVSEAEAEGRATPQICYSPGYESSCSGTWPELAGNIFGAWPEIGIGGSSAFRDRAKSEDEVPCDRHELFDLARGPSPGQCWTPRPRAETASTPVQLDSRAGTALGSRCRSSSPSGGLSKTGRAGSTTPSVMHHGDLSARLSNSVRPGEEPASPCHGFRVVVQLPGGARVGILVHPKARIGPNIRKRPDSFADIWGDAAEEQGDGRARLSTPRPLTPFRKLLAERCGDLDQADEYLASQVFKESSALSLKELVEASTGTPAHTQKLVFAPRGPLDNDDRLVWQCGIRDGSILSLGVKPSLKAGQMVQRRLQFWVAPPGPPARGRQNEVILAGAQNNLYCKDARSHQKKIFVPITPEQPLRLDSLQDSKSSRHTWRSTASAKMPQVTEPLPAWSVKKAAPVGAEFPPVGLNAGKKIRRRVYTGSD
eukprot:TRINITY_DN24157_c0_g1_i1.p1 TRINITY_DN24157_c0_g1~~TRINITY_DN24157_c0_g1_i1.p1  ORF type:complete len:433 (-),score=68.89 TRINITY_DN24157_c0_g1_i1:382-1680(-)